MQRISDSKARIDPGTDAQLEQLLAAEEHSFVAHVNHVPDAGVRAQLVHWHWKAVCDSPASSNTAPLRRLQDRNAQLDRRIAELETEIGQLEQASTKPPSDFEEQVRDFVGSYEGALIRFGPGGELQMHEPSAGPSEVPGRAEALEKEVAEKSNEIATSNARIAELSHDLQRSEREAAELKADLERTREEALGGVQEALEASGVELAEAQDLNARLEAEVADVRWQLSRTITTLERRGHKELASRLRDGSAFARVDPPAEEP